MLLPLTPDSCPACRLPLRDPLTHELLRTLEYADSLLVRLRAVAPVAGPVTAPITADLPTYPRPNDPAPAIRGRHGLLTASVPTILLGLGALCLLVAAVTFLAFAWTWMGVGGRTAVLAGLTAAAGGAGIWLGRRGLRVAAESLTTVSLGLVALDLAGAVTAGWFGPRSDEALVLLAGAGVAAVGWMMVVAPARLVAPQLGACLGMLVAFMAGIGISGHDRLLGVAAIAVFGASAWAARVLGARALTAAAAFGATGWWVWLTGRGLLDAIAEPTVRSLWIDGNGYALAAGAGIVLLAGIVVPDRPSILRGATAVASAILSFLVVLPALDEGGTAVGLAALVALVVWSGAAVLLPTSWAVVPAVNVALAAVPALVVSVALVSEGLNRISQLGDPFTRTADVSLVVSDAPAHPALLVPLVAALLLAGTALSGSAARVLWPIAGSSVLALAAIASMAAWSYAVPLAAITVALSVLALALAAVALRATRGLVAPLAATGVSVLSLGVALPSDLLTTCSAAAAVGVAALLALARSAPARQVGDVLLPATLGVLVWMAGDLAGLDPEWRALPVLVAMGLLVLARPLVATELVAASVGLVASVISVQLAADVATSLAIHLTVAGALVTFSSLVHADRRVLAWPGGLLLAAATWVRLFDLGVTAPEAYTLPTALVLVAVGLHRIWRDPGTSTDALLPGLSLATIPSLLWVIAVDPVSPRAVLLGAACLAFLLVGSQLRWSTPLVVGAVVGGLLVLREVAPYAEATPRWVMIGLAGTVLTVVGVTWERRVVELREAAAYLGRLR